MNLDITTNLWKRHYPRSRKRIFCGSPGMRRFHGKSLVCLFSKRQWFSNRKCDSFKALELLMAKWKKHHCCVMLCRSPSGFSEGNWNDRKVFWHSTMSSCSRFSWTENYTIKIHFQSQFHQWNRSRKEPILFVDGVIVR
jgi:hypothetical protein